MPIESAYLDSSAIIKLLLPEEAGSHVAASIFGERGSSITSQLGYVETWSGLMRRRRTGELADQHFQQVQIAFEQHWNQLFPLAVTESRIHRATDLVRRFPLSGADAIHLATALDAQRGGRLLFVTWDRRQASAAAALGFAVQPSID